MSYENLFNDLISLFVEGRISKEDALRQEKTAREILKRLSSQPGVILADEVGMGKTFVALAVAVSVALADSQNRPVIIMVPPSLKEKWPADFELFKEKCIPKNVSENLNYGKAERAEQFLKLLDDPPERKKQIIFVTHGVMSRGLTDEWIKFAIIKQSIFHRKNIDPLKRALSRFMGKLLLMGWVDKIDYTIWEKLLKSDSTSWKDILTKRGIDPEHDNDLHTNDDPVPESICKILPKLDTDEIFKCLKNIPHRQSKHLKYHLSNTRQEISKQLRPLWEQCIRSLELKLPLLILDEAHHLKNPKTRLASLFQDEEAEKDAEELKGYLAGVFERMLFLTATPFQLGHGELCSVLERFSGISWVGNSAHSGGKEKFTNQIKELRFALDTAQERATRLDKMWGKLKREDLIIDQTYFDDENRWWEALTHGTILTPTAEQVFNIYNEVYTRMKNAESFLRPWVIRHSRCRYIEFLNKRIERRKKLPGKLILSYIETFTDDGIPVGGNALLLFLLAARAIFHTPQSRPVFAEGLASSYESFLHTRRINQQKKSNISESDSDDDPIDKLVVPEITKWYLDQLDDLISKENIKGSINHPKVSATVNCATKLWKSGEKVLVFCHYIVTGKILRIRISEYINQEILKIGSEKFGCSPEEAGKELNKIGDRFFDKDSPIRRTCDNEVMNLLQEYPLLSEYSQELREIVSRYMRTPSFLVRFLPLHEGKITTNDVLKAFNKDDQSGFNLRKLLQDFLIFLVERCGVQDRRRYIEEVNNIQTGSHYGSNLSQLYSDDELQDDNPDRLIPNVRLVNGSTRSETRQRLMLTFNTPFYPEVLIASSVMAEGVDLQLNCRYVIHHDLCWNPSTLEQRNGRIDRIGAKAERYGEPINIFLPYIAETQDEKMYRVVMDRERWFNVVMGEKYNVDLKTTEKIANRIPFPEKAAKELAFRLEV